MPIHKQLDSAFLRLVAALLFVALCAWLGAALYAALQAPAAAADADAPRELALEAIAVRRELLLRSRRRSRPLAACGKRLPCGGALAVTAGGRALVSEQAGIFFADWDGLERLSPAQLETPDVAAVQALLESEADSSPGAYGRLVLDAAWYLAALTEDGAPLQAGMRCALRIEGIERPLRARLLSVSEESAGRRALLLRLTEGGADCLSLRRCRAWLLLGEETHLERNED